MSDADPIAQAVRAPLNRERARAFTHPLFQLASDSVVVGYSLTEVNGELTTIEVNQVRDSSRPSELVSASCRSFANWEDPDVELELHALDVLMAEGVQGSADERRDRAAAAFAEAPRTSEQVVVDGGVVPASVVTVRGSAFVQFFVAAPPTLVTAAVPADLLDGGFTSALP